MVPGANGRSYNQLLEDGDDALAEQALFFWGRSALVQSGALTTLKGKPKVKRAMWSRRAQEYEQKINSGDLIAIAEVVRDLHRNDEQREQSYSERQLYEAALDRLTREVAAVDDGDEVAAARKVDSVLVSRAA